MKEKEKGSGGMSTQEVGQAVWLWESHKGPSGWWPGLCATREDPGDEKPEAKHVSVGVGIAEKC